MVTRRPISVSPCPCSTALKTTTFALSLQYFPTRKLETFRVGKTTNVYRLLKIISVLDEPVHHTQDADYPTSTRNPSSIKNYSQSLTIQQYQSSKPVIKAHQREGITRSPPQRNTNVESWMKMHNHCAVAKEALTPFE